jgi:hypothetical protein
MRFLPARARRLLRSPAMPWIKLLAVANRPGPILISRAHYVDFGNVYARFSQK